MKLRLQLVSCLFFFLFSSSLQAETNSPHYSCRNGAFPSYTRNFQIGEVLGQQGSKVYVINDNDPCLNFKSSQNKCKKEAFVVGGSKHLVSHQYEGYACIYFGDSAGLVHSEQLKLLKPKENPELSNWVGIWKDGDSKISIQSIQNNSQLQIKGEAYWYGAILGPKERVVHDGELEGRVSPTGNKLTIGKDSEFENPKNYECIARLTLVNQYLLVADNSRCGGANVRFDGVYKRIPKKKMR